MTHPPYVLSLDIGTSSTRALLFEARGQQVPGMIVGRLHRIETSIDGTAVLEPDQLVNNVVECIKELLRQAEKEANQIVGVGMCTLWHSILGVDENNRACTPFYTWADTRSAAEVDRLRQTLDEQAFHQRLGVVFHTSYVPAKLLWIKRTRGEELQKSKRWMSIGEYLLLRLFGDTHVSHSMASGTGLYNGLTHDWDTEILTLLPICKESLSPISDEPFIGLAPPYKQELAQLSNVPFYPAYGDGAMNNVGSDCIKPQRVALMIGTSAVMRIALDAEMQNVTIPWGLWRYQIDRTRALIGGAMSNGGNVLEWLMNMLGYKDTQEVEAAIGLLEPASHGLTFLPFLVGERSVHWNARAQGVLAGITWDTKQKAIMLAGLEGIAYQFRLVYELLKPLLPAEHEIWASGGALLRLPTWLQTLSDVLNHPIHALGVSGSSARGAALMVLANTKTIHLEDGFLNSKSSLLTPRTEFNDIHEAAFRRHQEYYGAVSCFWV